MKTPTRTNHVAHSINAADYYQMRKGDSAILFFRQSCPHCVETKPIWNQVVKRLGEKHPNLKVKLAKLNTKKYPKIAETENIRMVPTIKFYKKGFAEPVIFSGERSVDTMVDSIVNHYAPTTTPSFSRRPPPPRPQLGSKKIPVDEMTASQFLQWGLQTGQ